MSDDETEDSEEIEDYPFKPKPQSAMQRAISDLMAKGMSYDGAYQVIMNPPKPQNPNDWYDPEPIKQQPKQYNIENLHNIINDLNSQAEDLETAKQEFLALKREVESQTVVNNEQLEKQRKQFLELDEIQKNLELKQKQYQQKESALQKQQKSFTVEVQEFEQEKAAHKRKRRGFVKKIDNAAIAEFDRSW
jgi:hypothetical protein